MLCEFWERLECEEVMQDVVYGSSCRAVLRCRLLPGHAVCMAPRQQWELSNEGFSACVRFYVLFLRARLRTYSSATVHDFCIAWIDVMYVTTLGFNCV